jgi:hypothetical protein
MKIKSRCQIQARCLHRKRHGVHRIESNMAPQLPGPSEKNPMDLRYSERIDSVQSSGPICVHRARNGLACDGAKRPNLEDVSRPESANHRKKECLRVRRQKRASVGRIAREWFLKTSGGK